MFVIFVLEEVCYMNKLVIFDDEKDALLNETIEMLLQKINMTKISGKDCKVFFLIKAFHLVKQ